MDDVLPPPEYPPVQPSVYSQIPTRTPLATFEKVHASCMSGNILKFREILDSQSSSEEDFDICDFHAIMIEAIKLGDSQFIKELLDRGLPMDPFYALEAIQVNGTDALAVFLQNRWNINQPMSELKPPILGILFSYAIADEEMTAWLLDHGADPNRQCVIDLTPLSLAGESAPISIIQLMLSRGGDARKGQLIHHAMERHGHSYNIIAVLKLLIKNGADINSTMYEDHYPSRALFPFMAVGTALHKTAELGKVDVVRYLVSEGASLSIKDAHGRTALEYAQMLNQWKVVQAFEKGN